MKSSKLIKVICAASLALLVSGCDKKTPDLAAVNGKHVSQAQFDAFLKFKRISGEDDKRRDQAFGEYLDREALAAVIEGEPTLDRAAIEAETNESRKETVISRYFEEFLRDKVSDEAVKNYYDAHAADYEQKQAHVAHVLVRTNKAMSDEERKAKLTTAQGAYSKIQSGKDFAEVADADSEDRVSAKKGGDLGWLATGSIDPQFSKRAFEMKAGAVSEPFETPFGYHVVKVLEEAKVVKKPFEAVAGDIRYQLRNQAKEAELTRLKAKVKIEKKNAYVARQPSASK